MNLRSVLAAAAAVSLSCGGAGVSISVNGTVKGQSLKPADSVSGPVTLTGVSNGSYSGNFDVTFDSGDHLTGSFGASNCANLNVWFGSKTHGCG
jgi:hypothetical protein